MTARKNITKRKRRGRLRGVIASVVSLCVLIALALLLIPGGPGPGITGIKRWLFGAGELAEEFYFSLGSNKVFADLGDGIAAAGELGIQVLDYSGEESIREQLRLSSPTLDASGGRAVVYDLGGSALRVIDSGSVIASQESGEPIISASINEKGWYCVSTQGSAGKKSSVTVYSSKGGDEYRVDMYSGYVLGARLFRDNKSLAILSITDTGGRVSFYSLDSEEPLESYNREGEVILEINWLSDGRVLAVTPTAVLVIDKNGQGSAIYEFGGRRLGGMCVSGGEFIALYLLDYGVGNEGRIVTLGGNGVIAELAATDENRGMSISGGALAVIWGRGLALYDRGLAETPLEYDGKASDVLIVSGEKVLAIGPRGARVVN